MARQPIDLATHINQNPGDPSDADFPVTLKPVLYRANGAYITVPKRMAVVREDTGTPLAVVSDRYTLVHHRRLLDAIAAATDQIDTGPVPRGIFLDRGGARMRAVFKFPSLTGSVADGDKLCPCIKIQNTYDGTSRITVHIGAFRFVCTNLAVGGGGAFAGGFMAVHSGEIPVDEIAQQLGSYLTGFDRILWTYQMWSEMPLDQDRVDQILEPLPERTANTIRERIAASANRTAYAAYNAATWHATHRMRSYRSAFELLRHINRGFQEHFPPSMN
ncbi:MAG: DUF932 domain-containing protein [Gemmatimonadota bacterium]